MNRFILACILISGVPHTEVTTNSYSNIKILKQYVASYYDGYHYVNDYENIMVGYQNYVVNPSFSENRYYSCYLKISFPKFEEIENLSLFLTKKSGDIQRLETSYYIYDLDFTQEVYTATGRVPIVYSTTNDFKIDLTEAANAALINNQNWFIIQLSMSYSKGYGEFYCDEDSQYSPFITILSTDTPTSNTYGSALDYQIINASTDTIINGASTQYDFQRNCYSYACNLDTKYSTVPALDYFYGYTYSDQLFESSISDNIISGTIGYGIGCRRIESHDAAIYNFEYRVAMRMKYNSYGIIQGYHFMRQCSDGAWSDKLPTAPTIKRIDFNPTTDDWGNGYDSKTIYFAVTHL